MTFNIDDTMVIILSIIGILVGIISIVLWNEKNENDNIKCEGLIESKSTNYSSKADIVVSHLNKAQVSWNILKDELPFRNWKSFFNDLYNIIIKGNTWEDIMLQHSLEDISASAIQAQWKGYFIRKSNNVLNQYKSKNHSAKIIQYLWKRCCIKKDEMKYHLSQCLYRIWKKYQWKKKQLQQSKRLLFGYLILENLKKKYFLQKCMNAFKSFQTKSKSIKEKKARIMKHVQIIGTNYLDNHFSHIPRILSLFHQKEVCAFIIQCLWMLKKSKKENVNERSKWISKQFQINLPMQLIAQEKIYNQWLLLLKNAIQLKYNVSIGIEFEQMYNNLANVFHLLKQNQTSSFNYDIHLPLSFSSSSSLLVPASPRAA